MSFRWKNSGCPYPIEEKGCCIFHLPKSTEEEKEEMRPEERAKVEKLEHIFRDKFFALLNSGESDTSIEFNDFSEFQFPYIDFSKKKFLKKLVFDGSTFSQSATFHDVIFDCVVDFNGVNFRRGVSFYGASFNRDASFMAAIFSDEASPGQAMFIETTFKQKANFMQARFNGWANFATSHFNQDVYFFDVVFNNVANFIKARFEQHSSFSGSTFNQKASFSASSFFKAASFHNVTVVQEISFTNYGDSVCNLKECDFRNLNLKKDSDVVFEKVNLSKARFLGTNLEEITFRDVVWYKAKSTLGAWLSRPQSLWDEFRPLEEEDKGEYDFEKIADNYRQLVLNYEGKRDYEAAENFHIGEMEMRRKKREAKVKPLWWRRVREWVNAYGIYRISSNYGTSYEQGFTVLILLIFIFSLIFLYSGFRPSRESTEASRPVIEYNLLSDSNHNSASIGQWFSDYGAAISFSVSIITFQRDRFYEPVEGWSRFWLYVAVFVLTTQSALVLLAIRRRFKR